STPFRSTLSWSAQQFTLVAEIKKADDRKESSARSLLCEQAACLLVAKTHREAIQLTRKSSLGDSESCPCSWSKCWLYRLWRWRWGRRRIRWWRSYWGGFE